MSKNNLSNVAPTSYSLYNKAQFKQTPRILVVLLCMSYIFAPVQSTLADQSSTALTQMATPVAQIDPTVLTDTFIAEDAVEAINYSLTTNLTNNATGTNETTANNNEATLSEQTALTDSIIAVAEDLASSITPVPIASLPVAASPPLVAQDIILPAGNEPLSDDLLPEGPPEPFIHHNQTDSQVTFNTDNCVLVGTGSFYCQHANDTAQANRADGVYAYPDRDGDLEIFIQRNSELEQITQNQVDDSSPWFDYLSNTIVWHRLLDGRYHIISYDLATQFETQITTGSTNNMEPTRQGNYTAWQTWLDNNWEIVLYDGESVFRITHSSEADLSPQLRNGLLVWHQITASGERRVFIYNIETKEQLTLEGEGNELITNARLMIVFDSQQSNGEVLVKGYDLVTGEIVPIANQTNQLPAQIPDPNPVGEPTALFPANNKSDITKVDGETPNDPDRAGNIYPPTILTNDFDDEATLVLFDYGVASSTDTTPDIALEVVDEIDFTLDLRTPDPLVELTIAIPLYESTTTTNEGLSSSR